MKIGQWDLVSLSPEWFPTVLDITDRHLGPGLYNEETLEKIVSNPHHYFRIVLEGQTPVGIFYCLAGPADTLKKDYPWIPMEGNRICGMLRSIAIEENARNSGLSAMLVNAFSALLFEKENAEAIYVLTWVQKEFVPAAFHLTRCGFSRGRLLAHPWYDDPNLKCPYCGKEHCICDGIIFEKERGAKS